MYLTQMDVTPTEIVFYVQSRGTGSNVARYRARLAFQFDKGYLSTAAPKEVLETIGLVFGIDTSKGIIDPPRVPPVPLKLPATYVSAQAQADQLQLNADNTFSLQEAGQTYRGTFSANGSTLELKISGAPEPTTATIQGNNLTDSSGQTWTLREQPERAVSSGGALQNQDIVKMAKAGFDDAIIIAKIGSSKCQFDTSTDALIQLKESGVSAAVLQAMVGAGK
jgi:hypothetical protein